MSNEAVEEEARDQGLEIQSERRSAVIGAVEDAQDRHRVAEEDASASGRSGAEREQAAVWAYDDPSSSYGPRR
ncbi:hypothetical protein [Flexivirga oryzae]|uniref:Uncharacterized protein n=1 Tax=Flexivirga oryzae TaxID=1794944 RepID=A0A839N8X2_9MICO|nr:hypothetical protein [Flexivirga oryzae]MBB2892086.1 hypothetical protein [Flexivirga oryzae]